MKFYTKKGKLPGDEKFEDRAPNYTIIGIKMTWEQATTPLRWLANLFSKNKNKNKDENKGIE